jgi:hypothetical protein
LYPTAHGKCVGADSRDMKRQIFFIPDSPYLKKKKFSSLRRDNDYMRGIKFRKGFENPRPVYKEPFLEILSVLLHFLPL